MTPVELAREISLMLSRLSPWRTTRVANVIKWGGNETTITVVERGANLRLKLERMGDGVTTPYSTVVQKEISQNSMANPANHFWTIFERFEEQFYVVKDAAPSSIYSAHGLKEWRRTHPDPIRSDYKQ